MGLCNFKQENLMPFVKNIFSLLLISQLGFSQLSYKIIGADTNDVMDEYKCEIRFDSSKLKPCDKIYLTVFNTPLEKRTPYIFKLQVREVQLSEIEYDLKVKWTMCNDIDSFFTITTAHYNVLSTERAKKYSETKGVGKIGKVGVNDFPQFKSDKFKSIEEFVLAKLAKESIKCKKVIRINYVVRANNKIKCNGIVQGHCSAEDEKKIIQAYELCPYYKARIINGKLDSTICVGRLDLGLLK